jgi:hypothetical protein
VSHREATSMLALGPSELAILQSVIYAGLFDYPLTLEELHRSLIGSTLDEDAILRTYRASPALWHAVTFREGMFFPTGRDHLLAERRRREQRSLAFLRRHHLLLACVCAIPYARMVALSGSIAHLNMDGAGDLDLFIVTRGRHVWSVTVAILVLAKLLRHRDVTCVNFIVADTHLTFEQQDLFTANQTIHLKPLIGTDVLPELLHANPFVAHFYPNYRAPRPPEFAFDVEQTALTARIKSAVERIGHIPAAAIEAICHRAYSWHLRRRAASWQSPAQVRLEPDYLKLHTRSHRRSILDRFSAAMTEALQTIDHEEQNRPTAFERRSSGIR